MKNHLTLALFIFYSLSVFSQQTSFPITYNLTLNSIKDKSDHRNNPAETLYEEKFLDEEGKRISMTITHTPFYPDMMDKILEYFVKHVEANKTVKNYTNNSYFTGIQEMSRGSLKKLNDPSLYQKWGGYYLDLENNIMTWDNGVAKGKGRFGSDVTVGYDGVYHCFLTQTYYNWPPYDLYDTVICDPGGSELIEGMGFSETWNFDAQKGNFTKEIKMLSIREFILDQNTSELKGVETPLNFMATSNPDTQYLFKKNVQYDVFFDNWNKCNPNYIDGCEVIKNEMKDGGSTLNTISSLHKSKLCYSILKSIQDGKLIALDPFAYDHKKEKPLSQKEVEFNLCTYDTTLITMPYPPYETVETVFVKTLVLDEVIGIRFIEDWYFDPVSFNFYKRIKAFALLTTFYNNNTAELLGYRNRFYLKPNN